MWTVRWSKLTGQLTTMIVIWLTTTSLFTLWSMEFTSYTLFLIAIMVLLGVITIGAGAAVFCCFGWESCLPVIYTNKLMHGRTSLSRGVYQTKIQELCSTPDYGHNEGDQGSRQASVDAVLVEQLNCSWFEHINERQWQHTLSVLFPLLNWQFLPLIKNERWKLSYFWSLWCF